MLSAVKNCWRGGVRDTLVVDAQAGAEGETSLVSPECRTDVVSTGETDVSQVH